MKHFILFGLLLAAFAGRGQGVGIGTTAPDASAALDVRTTTQGLLLPRLMAAQRQAIANPAQGLLVCQTDGTLGLYLYTGAGWVNLTDGRVPDATGSTVPLNGTVVSGAKVSTLVTGVAVDVASTVYLVDISKHDLRKFPANGTLSQLAGSSTPGYVDATGPAASFNTPTGVAADGAGTLYVADQVNHVIRKVTAAGVTTTLAGTGAPGYRDGSATTARFNGPTGVAVDGAGTLYVADQNNHVIRKITPAGAVSTLAGTAGTAGFADGAGTAAQFNGPTGVAVDAAGTLYVADRLNNRIRKITPAGVVTTLAGSNSPGYVDGPGATASFKGPFGVAVDAGGAVYVADTDNNVIRKITAVGVVGTLAGSGTAGNVAGTGTAALFNTPTGVAVDRAGVVYVADQGNGFLRYIR